MSVARNQEPSIIVGVDTLAPIAIEAMKADALLSRWYDEEEAICVRGISDPGMRLKCARDKRSVDTRVFVWIEGLCGSYGKDYPNVRDMPVRAFARHFLWPRAEVLHLNEYPPVENEIKKHLRWMNKSVDRYIDELIADFLTYIDIKKVGKRSL